MEADFQREYRINLGELWRGTLAPTRAARLCAHLPPGSAIYRHGDNLDARMFSLEALLLRVLINDQREPKDRMLTVDQMVEQAEKIERKKAAAVARAQRMRRAVSDA